MLPPGLSFNAVSEKALAPPNRQHSQILLSWEAMLTHNKSRVLSYTPATLLLYGLDPCAGDAGGGRARERVPAPSAIGGGDAPGRRGWGLGAGLPATPASIRDPHGRAGPGRQRRRPAQCPRAGAFRCFSWQGLGKLDRRAFRIGHLGDLNETTSSGPLQPSRWRWGIADIPHRRGGVLRALDYLMSSSKERSWASEPLSVGHQA